SEREEFDEDVLVVGIGASAGGLEALQRFFKAVPEDGGGVAFVVVMHLDPERQSQLAELLQTRTTLAVQQVTERQALEPGHVYVIPPNKNLLVTNHHLDLADFEQPRGRRAPIDRFFRSLADGRRTCVGVVLSGSGTDGTLGLKAIKEQGGVVMAQDPADAEYDAMPRSAIATGLVDLILPAEALAQRVVEFSKNHRRIQIPGPSGVLPQDDSDALYQILSYLRSRTGHDFTNYKQSTVLRRIGRRMQVNQIETLAGYLRFLKNHPAEAQALLKSMFISVTHFFRDREAWAAMAERVIPRVLEDARPDRQVRVWVPGCATGEEAYTLAMLLLESAAQTDPMLDLQVFASDLDQAALAYGRQGLYPDSIGADLSEERLRRFFTRDGNHYRIKKEVRERVLFAQHSLLKDPPFSRLDLISCRNLLIYLNRELQGRVFRLFHYGLRPGGFLFLGSAESADGEGRLFRPVVKKQRIYQRMETGDVPRLPALELAHERTPIHTEAMHRSQSELERHRELLEQQAPPSVLVGRNFEILHLSETAGRYLQRPGGVPSNDILREVRPELRLDLQAALHHAFENGKRTSTHAVEVAFNGDTGWVHLIVIPGRGETGSEDEALVLFAEVQTTGLIGEGAEPGAGTGTDRAERARYLDEVQHLREHLQATVEEYESSREEMKASNEELQSINEEYKSTAEELETSKEELQSVNEELETVNQELKSKVEELSQSNSDLQNLMDSTEIGTLFLDRHLCIQRYTPRIAELFSVMPGDVGRPITHLTHTIDYDDLVEDAERVRRDLVMVEMEVRGHAGAWYLMRMRPYRTVEDRIDGVVIMFVDITERRRQEEARRKAEERYRLLVESVEEYAMITIDLQGLITTWNAGAERLFGYAEDEAVGQEAAFLFTEADRAAGQVERELAAAEAAGQATDERWHVRKDGSRFWGTGVITALRFPDGALRGYANVMRDNTERKQAEETLEQRVEERTIQVRNLASRLTMAEQEERRRISRILHDDLQQRLYGIQMKLDLLRREAETTEHEPLTRELARIDEWLTTAISTTRSLTVDLSPPILKTEGLTDALIWLRTQMAEQHGLDVTVQAAQPFYLPDEDMRVLLFQVVRELLFNVVKHAETDGAVVEISEDGSHLVIVVRDDGRGFDPEAAAHQRGAQDGLGLFSVRERLRLFGGDLEIEAAPGRGTRVTVRTPVGSLRRDTSS
ncbi:MAG: chemotaxis protein CheB, partial [Rhodothermales bacterium]|nr:chemotaxis protein CheB [Rhodothermales bacterium]